MIFREMQSLAIINKLERYNGCILTDSSMGLGKTFGAGNPISIMRIKK